MLDQDWSAGIPDVSGIVEVWLDPVVNTCARFVKYILIVLIVDVECMHWGPLISRERTIRARLWSDRSTRCAGVPVTYVIIPGSLGERSYMYFTQWVAHSIQGSTCRPLATRQLARSVTFTTGEFVETLVWLTFDTVVITACWWGEGSAASSLAGRQYCASWCPVSWGGWYQVTVSLLPPLQPSPVSWIIWRSRAAGDPRGGWPARMSFDLLFNETC